ncbi:TerB family tellurite resistance protein [Pontibacter sp. 172403-2]|uniref:tellurite resistance TerB family protein n=1 Tax=Pontibacter rufus TaxID=2791028 RepID=UPI0018AF7FC9|nr:tellurite resistance TerB family protein [Pontibacter sp. 172403-2]MBF9252558.1 TerB family tellurite resistance protein [Pontibacter sp. 172403-2]
MEGIFNTSGKSAEIPAQAYSPQNEQEAWIAVMQACIAVDNNVADEELDILAQTLANKKLFKGHDIMAYCRTVFYAHAQFGSKVLIDNSIDKIAVENRATLFALTIQLVLSDCIINDKEKELITYLYSALDLETDVANRIVDTVLILNKDNTCS